MLKSKDRATFLAFLTLGLVFQYVASFTIIVEKPEEEKRDPIASQPPRSEEFRRWLQFEGEKAVQRIMDKIASPNDTIQQYEAKVAVARYLVNVTFSAMTNRLNLGKSIQYPETAGFPETASIPETSTEQVNATDIEIMEGEAQNVTSSTTPGPVEEEMLVVLGGGNLTSPEEAIPASAPATVNMTEAMAEASRPIWQELLMFNFSSAIRGGGPGSFINISRLTNREGGSSLFNLSRFSGGEGGNSLFNLSRLSGGEGGNSLFNLSRFSGGQGGNALFNLSRFSGGEGGNALFNLSRFSGGGGGGSSLFNLSRFSGGEGGNQLFNLTRLGGGFPAGVNLTRFGGGLNLTRFGGGLPGGFNLTQLGGEGGGLSSLLNISSGNFSLPSNLAPPEGFLNYPTPPPKNDSVRVSQMNLVSNVDKLVTDINKSNLTGVVDSTINIATPSTVGVLVNALLNIVLCNPLDRWNGNCGI